MDSNDEETKLLYLLSGSCDVLPSSCVKLRSYLKYVKRKINPSVIHVSNLADQQNLQLLKSFRNRNKTCPYCYSSWSADTTSFKLLPSKRSRRSNPQSKRGKSETSLLNESRNTLVLKCKVCTRKSSFSLVKRKLVEETVKENSAECVKKKKKKTDKSCGLVVNLIQQEKHSPDRVVIKKKKRMEGAEKSNSTHPQIIQSKIPQKNIPIAKTLVSGTGKNLVPNPFAADAQQGFSGKKKDKKLEKLKLAVKEEKNLAKKTLQDFLKLV